MIDYVSPSRIWQDITARWPDARRTDKGIRNLEVSFDAAGPDRPLWPAVWFFIEHGSYALEIKADARYMPLPGETWICNVSRWGEVTPLKPRRLWFVWAEECDAYLQARWYLRYLGDEWIVELGMSPAARLESLRDGWVFEDWERAQKSAKFVTTLPRRF